jgi:nucleoside-diphosphate-sugar epimerase
MAGEATPFARAVGRGDPAIARGGMSMKVLLTGATGFLGGEVLRQLLADDAVVTALVRPNGGELADRLGAVGRSERVRVVPGGLHDRDALSRASEGADVVIHLAGGQRGAEHDVDVNVEGTRSVVDACVQSGVRRLVFASTTAVYGLTHPRSAEPLREGAPLVGHVEDAGGSGAAEDVGLMRYLEYGRSKAAAERIVRDVAGNAGVEWVVLRPDLVYGAGAAAFEAIVKRVAAHPLRAAERGLRETLQPIHLRDAAEAFVLAATGRGIDRATINVAGAEHVTHRAFVRLVRRALGLGATDGWHEDALPSLMYDIRRARAELGFEPRIALAPGVRDAVRKLQVGTTSPRSADAIARWSWLTRRPVGMGARWR